MNTSKLVALTVATALVATLSFGAYSVGRTQANEAKTRFLIDHIIPQMVQQVCKSVDLYFNVPSNDSEAKLSASLTKDYDVDAVVEKVVRQVVEQVQSRVDHKVRLEVQRQMQNERRNHPTNSAARGPVS